jgi:hypothetical protein
MNKDNHPVGQNDIKRILSAVFTLCLLNQELSEGELESLITAARAEARKKIRSLSPQRASSVDLVLLGSVLHRWHRNSMYLDGEARPFPIRATGKAPSIEALFQAENRKQYYRKGIDHMRKAGLVRRTKTGLYLPCNDSILLHALTPEMVANVALAMNRLMTTLLYNTASSRQREERLIERNALVTDLPKRKLKEFIRFSREQGAALVSTMNDWLEHGRADEESIRPRSKRSANTVGIHVFAFCDEKSKTRE